MQQSARQVQALEADDYAMLPGRTFVRGFLRNYARLLGLVNATLEDVRADGRYDWFIDRWLLQAE